MLKQSTADACPFRTTPDATPGAVGVCRLSERDRHASCHLHGLADGSRSPIRFAIKHQHLGLDWVTHRGPFQPLPFCDSVIKATGYKTLNSKG